MIGLIKRNRVKTCLFFCLSIDNHTSCESSTFFNETAAL